MKVSVCMGWLVVMMFAIVAASQSVARAQVAPRLVSAQPHIAFHSNRDGDYEIYLMNEDGSGLERLTNNSVDDTAPCISPDGNQIVFSSAGNIWEMNIDGSNLTQITNDAAADTDPAYSPDGTRIAYSTNKANGDFDVYIVNRNGTNPRRLTVSYPGDYSASWSPDGSQLVYGSFYGTSFVPQIARHNSDGTGFVWLTTGVVANSSPDWGSNNKIVYSTQIGGNHQLFMMDPDATNKVQITNLAATQSGADWSPDASRIVFQTNLNGNSEIYTINANGTGLTRLTNHSAIDAAPSWGPSPTQPILPALSIADATVTEGDTGSKQLVFTVTLNKAGAAEITVNYATVSQTAVAGADFTPVSGTLTFPAGTLARTIVVPILGDALYEGEPETFAIDLASPAGANLMRPRAIGKIVDNDPMPRISINNISVGEGDLGTSDAVFTVTLSAPSGLPASANYTTVAGTATAGSDFEATTGTVSFAPGEVTKIIIVPVVGDTLNEIDETFTVRFTSSLGATVEGTPILNPANGHYYELIKENLRWSAARVAAHNRTFDGVAGHLVTITSQAEQDFIKDNLNILAPTAAGGTQPAGSSEPGGGWQWVTGEPFVYTHWRGGEPNNVVNEDSLQLDAAVLWNDVDSNDFQPQYLVEYDLQSPPAAPSLQGVATITNNDLLPSITVDSFEMQEGNSGSSFVSFVVDLSAASGRDVSVDYATSNGTAVAPSDYIAKSGTLIIPAGSTRGSIIVTVNRDTTVDGDVETFFVTLSDPVNATIEQAVATATIIDDDGMQLVSVNNVSVVEGDSGYVDAVFTISLSAPSTRTVTVGYNAVGVGTVGTDHEQRSGTLTFAPGELSKTVAVPVIGDTLVEEDETFEFMLGNAVNATIAGNGKGIGTILDDDGSPQLVLSIDRESVSETAGANAATATVRRRQTDFALPLTVAVASSDTTEARVPATVTIPAGAASVTFPVSAIDETLVDGPQTVNITVSSNNFASSTAELMVLDNDLGSIRGRVATSSGVGLANVGVSRTGGVQVMTDSEGYYVFNNLTYGSYTIAPIVTPALGTVWFTPQSRTVTTTSSVVSNINFTAGYRISGVVANHNGVGIPNVLVTRRAGTSATSVLTDMFGSYWFHNVPSGSYTIEVQVTPALNGVTVFPSSRAVTIGTRSLTNINFNISFAVSGYVTNNSGQGVPNVLVRRSTASGSATSVYTDSSGAYRFTDVRSGTYTIAPQVTPALNGISFTPASRSITVDTSNLTNINFNAMFSVSGRITDSGGQALAGATVTLGNGAGSRTTTTDANGNYRFTDVRSGNYTVTPASNGQTFTPASRSVVVGNTNVTSVNFLGSP